MSSQSHILSGSDGKQYFSLGNGCYMEVILPETNADETLIGNEPRYSSLDPTNLKPEKCDDDSYDDGMENSDIVSQLKTLNSRVEAVEARLDQLLVFMANIEKFITTRSAASASKEQKREPEDFGEFKKLCPILSEDQLQMVEHNLKNKPFADKFFRFFESEYNLNGKRDGRAFMKTILRRIVAPTILLPFSWKGNSRRTTDAVPFTPNRSFKDTFPEFVEFVQRIASAADMLHTAEQSDQCFSQFLRQKKVEVTRFLEGQGNRVVSSRKRKAKPQEEQHEENEENDGVEDM